MKSMSAVENLHSVIVCCYRGESTIQKCLMSLDSQDYDKEKYEVIIVDDGSLDGTEESIREYLENRSNELPIMKYFRKENQGLSIARNFGIQKSSGQQISFIDEDAKADPDFVKNVVSFFEKNPDINCLGGKVDIWNKEDHFARIYHYSLFNWKMLEKNFIIGTNMSFRTDFLDEVGGFVNQFDRRGDEDALYRKSGQKIKKSIAENVIVHHSQPSNKKHFIRNRYENGYYKGLIALMRLKRKENVFPLAKEWLGHFLFLALPVLVVITAIFNFQYSLVTLLLLVLIYIHRYFIKGELLGPVRFLKKSGLKVKFSDYLVLTEIIVKGFSWEDYGFMRAFFVKDNYKQSF